MTHLRLNAHLSYIEPPRKLMFISYPQDAESVRKLEEHAPGALKGDYFTVHTPRADTVSEFIGLDCVIHVKVTPFVFKSRMTRNLGTEVRGYKLTLENITQA